jgi:hypothetical protein
MVGQWDILSDDKLWQDDGQPVHRKIPPQLLRVCWAMHHEAARLLYTGLEIYAMDLDEAVRSVRIIGHTNARLVRCLKVVCMREFVPFQEIVDWLRQNGGALSDLRSIQIKYSFPRPGNWFWEAVNFYVEIDKLLGNSKVWSSHRCDGFDLEQWLLELEIFRR